MWKEENNKLSKTFKFNNFKEAFDFMTKVAFLAEHQGHHPNWNNKYNIVTIELTTHDEGNIVTSKDIKLANSIDLIIRKNMKHLKSFNESYEEKKTILKNKKTNQVIMLKKAPDGKITSIVNRTGIRFPFQIGQTLNQSINTWAHNNDFLINGEEPI